MPGAIEADGEAKAREYAYKFDGWDKDIVLSRAKIDTAIALVLKPPRPLYRAAC